MLRRIAVSCEDPRTYAALRIGLGLLAIVSVIDLLPYSTLLWSDEGVFDLDQARERVGRAAMRGWHPDHGFLGPLGLLNFAWNGASLLYLWGSPAFVHGYVGALLGLLTLYTAGVASRLTGAVAWALLLGLHHRNPLPLDGSDNALRCLLFILLFARTADAWGFDAWRRRRGEGALASTKVASWPRHLVMVQIAVLYASSGWSKTGISWREGEALYYVLSVEHLQRSAIVSQWVADTLGTNVLLPATWAALWWERAFPLVLLGLWAKALVRERKIPTFVSWVLGRRTWIGFGVCFHLALLVLLDLGTFPLVMLVASVAFFSGDELTSVLRRPVTVASPQPTHPAVRATAFALFVVHAGALVTGPRGRVEGLVSGWQRVTGTEQRWTMFAPQPPTHDVSVHTTVVAADGRALRLPNQGFGRAPDHRSRKMERRLASDSARRYLPAWAQYHCRRHQLRTGEPTRRVIIARTAVSIPPPSQAVAAEGPKQAIVLDESCEREGHPSVAIMERHGLPITEADRRREATRAEHRARRWERSASRWWARIGVDE